MKNSISICGLSEFVNEARETPEEANLSYGVKLSWETATRAQAETKTMAVGPHRVSRSFSWKVDEPRQILGTNQGPNPQEYLLSGVGACIMVAFVLGATAKGIQIDTLEIDIDGDLDLKGFMGLDSNQPVGFPAIRYRINVTGDATPEEFEEIHRQAVEHSPNAMTIVNPVALKGEVVTATGNSDDTTQTA